MSVARLLRAVVFAGHALVPGAARAQSAAGEARPRDGLRPMLAPPLDAGGAPRGLRMRDREASGDVRCPDVVCVDATALRWPAPPHDASRVFVHGLVVVGGASVVAAAVLWLVGAPRPAEVPVLRPMLSGGQVGVALAGRF